MIIIKNPHAFSFTAGEKHENGLHKSNVKRNVSI